jgi:PTS system nitrogen regulatory IIA component
MHLVDLLAPARIRANASATSKKRLLELIAATLNEGSQDTELERRIYDGLCARERLGSTGLGRGVAIPHGRITGLAAPVGAFLRLGEPLPFDAADGQPVDLVFALVVPEHFSQQHLLLLSQLAEMFSDSDFCMRLRGCRADAALHTALSDWQIAHLAA